MAGLQHQQMRAQQGIVAGGLGSQGMSQAMGQTQGMGQGPMQMNNLNQQMITHMQQQQAIMQQQSSNQVSNFVFLPLKKDLKCFIFSDVYDKHEYTTNSIIISYKSNASATTVK